MKLYKLKVWRSSPFFSVFSILLLLLTISAACNKKPTDVAVSSIKLNMTSITFHAGETVELSATISPDNATYKTVTWSSSNTSIATVTDGKVTALAVGSTTIIAQCGNVKAECSVTVNPINVTSIRLNRTSVSLSAGDIIELTATVSPDNATNKTVTWISSNTSIATVTDSKVTAVNIGSATITAKSNNGLSATCHISVVSKDVSAGGSEGTGEVEW